MSLFRLSHVRAQCSGRTARNFINTRQSRTFPHLEMLCSADQNKQLSNQSVNLESRDAMPKKNYY